MAMNVDPTGKKAVVSSQSMKCSSQVEKEEKPEDVLKLKEEDPKYSPQSEEGKHEYSPQSDEEFDKDMYDDTNDDTYGDDFFVDCDIVSVLPTK